MEKFTVEKWHCREVFHCTKCPYTSWSREDVIAHYDSKHAPPVKTKQVEAEQATASPREAEVEQEKCAECEKRAKKPRKRKSKKES